MTRSAINRDTVSGEALFILKNLRENSRLGRSNKLADVKAALEPAVSLEFDTYFFFLRKLNYIAMDREAQLLLTDPGERVVEGDDLAKFADEVGEFFSEELMPPEETQASGVHRISTPHPESADEDDAQGAGPEDTSDEGHAEEVSAALVSALADEGPDVSVVDDEDEDLNADAAIDDLGGELGDFLSEKDAADLPPPLPSIPAMPAIAPALPSSRPRLSRERSAVLGDEPMPSSTSGSGSHPAGTGSPASASTPSSSGASSAGQSSFTARVDMMEVRREGVSSPGTGAPRGQDLDLRYVKYDLLGNGPLGTVHKGKHNALGMEVAIKELKDIFGYFSFLQRSEVIKRLKRELCAQAQVRHPGIVAVLDQNTDVARPYFVMELMRGNLREKLDAAGPKGLPAALAIRTFLQLSYGLRAAHQAGLFHHNIKAENVLYDAYGNARLSDFGLGRVIEVDASKGMPQVFVGTGGMNYLAPELIGKSSKDAGAAADVYGLGILLYEMLTGGIPGRRSPLPSEVNTDAPSKLDPVFDKMTQDRRETRYPDFDAMLEDFYGAFSDGEYLVRGDLVLASDPLKVVVPEEDAPTPSAV